MGGWGWVGGQAVGCVEGTAGICRRSRRRTPLVHAASDPTACVFPSCRGSLCQRALLSHMPISTQASQPHTSCTACLLLHAESTGALYRRWYEVLAPHFCKSWEASERLLALCRQLWGQPFTAPTYSLLLYQWLLVHKEAGGVDQRLKHLNVLFSGAQAGLASRQAGRGYCLTLPSSLLQVCVACTFLLSYLLARCASWCAGALMR